MPEKQVRANLNNERTQTGSAKRPLLMRTILSRRHHICHKPAFSVARPASGKCRDRNPGFTALPLSSRSLFILSALFERIYDSSEDFP
jgi:hypothetical protein